MKINNIIFWVLGLAVAATSCAINEPVDGSELPEGAYIRLNFSSDAVAVAQKNATKAAWSDPNGSGNLTFNWETVGIDSEETKKLALVISDGEKALPSKAPSQEQATTYSGLAVTPRQGNAHYANFQSVGYYATSDLRNAKYCFAVSGNPAITENTSGKKHVFRLPEMPSTFTQPTNQDPSFLRDNMYMYSTTTYNANGNTLSFNNIPATFRFVISNATAKAMSLEEIYVSLSHNSSQAASSSANIKDWDDSSMDILQMAVEEGAIASKNSTVTFNWENGTAQLAFGDEAYDKISVLPGETTSIAPGEKYTAYAMVMPLNDNNAFNGKTVNFSIKGGDHDQIGFQLTGTKLAAINGSGNIYNWVSGKSYTIRLNIGADGKVTGEVEVDKTIRVESNETEPYYVLKYEDASGTPLTEYADICKLTVDEVARYKDFIDVNVAPREAETIGIYDSDGVRQGIILLSYLKPDYFEEPLYSFGLLSDVHIGKSGADPENDFKRALSFFKDKNAALTCICGDITENGTEAELQKYEQAVLDVYATNVFTTTGNHDCIYNNREGIDPELWSKYTHMPLVYEHTVERNGHVDHFLFLGMSYWYNNANVGFNAAYLDYHINWLENRLEEYRNERCFVITHLFFPERSGNLLEIYPDDNWLSGKQLTKLQSLCDRYVNSIWFSGHSHWQWQLQKYEDKANIYRSYQGVNPTSGWCVHVPSCAQPITSNGVPGTAKEREGKGEESEVALVQVYENHIDILGMSLDINSNTYKYQPIATYRLDTSMKTVPEDTTPKESHYLKADNFIYYKGDLSKMHKEDVPGTNYVDFIFEEPSQGYYVINETFYYGISDAASVSVEQLLCWTNWDEENQTGTPVSTIPHVGFWTGKYHLGSTNSCYVDPLNGIQFQTSSQTGTGDGQDHLAYPIKIRMQAQLVFSPAYEGGDDSQTNKYYLTASDFTKNKHKTNGTFSVKDSDDANYVEVEFNRPTSGSNKEQGFYLRNETFFFGMDSGHGQKVSIIVEDVIAYEKVGEEWIPYSVEDLGGVGFYTGAYTLQSSTGQATIHPALGVQFQTSNSSYVGPTNLKLKIKARMVYYAKTNKEIPSKYFLVAGDFKDNTQKADITVNDVGDRMLEVTFTRGSQGGLVLQDRDELKNTNWATIQISDLKILVGQNEKEVTEITGIGFRDSTTDVYFLKEGIRDFNKALTGIEFQSSSSQYKGEYPVKIRMKAAMICN